jgi:hypothetical protein
MASDPPPAPINALCAAVLPRTSGENMRLARSQSHRAAQNVLEGVARRGPHFVRAARAQTGLGHGTTPPRHPSHASTPFPSSCEVTARLLSPGCSVPRDMVEGSLCSWTASPRYFRASSEEYTGYLSRCGSMPRSLTHCSTTPRTRMFRGAKRWSTRSTCTETYHQGGKGLRGSVVE